jgi:transposase
VVLDRMAERLKTRPEILDTRREIVEHPFGSIKQWMNQGAFLMRGLDKVNFSLHADPSPETKQGSSDRPGDGPAAA